MVAAGRSASARRARVRDRRRRRTAPCAVRRVLARGSAARLRSASPSRRPRCAARAAALSPRDGAPALGPPAEARADLGAPRIARRRWPRAGAGALQRAGEPRPVRRHRGGPGVTASACGRPSASGGPGHAPRDACDLRWSAPVPPAPRAAAPAETARPAAPSPSAAHAPIPATPSVANLLVEDVSEPALARFRDAFLARSQAASRPRHGAWCSRPARRVDVVAGARHLRLRVAAEAPRRPVRRAAADARGARRPARRPADDRDGPRRSRPRRIGTDAAADRKGAASRPR